MAVATKPVTRQRGRVLAGTVLFVLGFSVVFTLGATLVANIGLALQEHKRLLEIIVGSLIIVLGLTLLTTAISGVLALDRGDLWYRHIVVRQARRSKLAIAFCCCSGLPLMRMMPASICSLIDTSHWLMPSCRSRDRRAPPSRIDSV